MRIRIRIEYDGTEFAGWQRQVGVRTVQAAVEDALAAIFETRISVLGASRTDAGVHAEGQVAAFRLPHPFDPSKLVRALDAYLPPDVAVHEAREVSDAFHPIRDAEAKQYRYVIWNARHRSPLRMRRSAFVPGRLDLGAMRAALPDLVGRHDFASFQSSSAEWAAKSRDGARPSTEREIFSCGLAGDAGGELVLDVVGSGFLRGMVRNLAGTLLEIGLGRRRPDALPALLAARDRRLAGPSAPPAGLTLLSVRYPAPAENEAETQR